MRIDIILPLANRIFFDILAGIFYWPIWWYSKGLVENGANCLNGFRKQNEQLGVMVWVNNIFTPMFGQYDITGRIISFFVRLIQITIRLILLLIWAAIFLILFLIWPLIPVLIIHQIFQNLIKIIA